MKERFLRDKRKLYVKPICCKRNVKLKAMILHPCFRDTKIRNLEINYSLQRRCQDILLNSTIVLKSRDL